MSFVEGASFDYIIAIGLCVAYLILDALYVRYTQFVIRKRPMHAATVSVFIHLLTAVGVLSYVEN